MKAYKVLFIIGIALLLSLLVVLYLRFDYGMGVKANKERLFEIEFEHKGDHSYDNEIQRLENYQQSAERFDRITTPIIKTNKIILIIILGAAVYSYLRK